MNQPQKTMSATEWGMLIVLSILWGGSFFFNGVAVKELPTFTVVVGRVALAALILIPVMRFMGVRLPLTAPVWAAFIGMGLINNAIPFTLIVWGQSHIASGVASILNATTPVFTVLVAHMFTADEKMSGGKVVGVLAGLAGVAVMITGGDLTSLAGGFWGQMACVGAAISYAFAGVFGRRFKDMGISPMGTAGGQVIGSSLVMVPMMLIIDRPWELPIPSVEAIAAVLGLASLSTALAYILYFRILATAGATNLLLVTLLVPVSAILLGVMVLNEVLEVKHIVGMALIGAGLAAIDGRPWRLVSGARTKAEAP